MPCLFSQVALEAAGLGAALAMDFATDSVEKNERERAVQMREVVERLGPAFVKVGLREGSTGVICVVACWERAGVGLASCAPFQHCLLIFN